VVFEEGDELDQLDFRDASLVPSGFLQFLEDAVEEVAEPVLRPVGSVVVAEELLER
jgi:hypothetical protein